MIKGRGVPDNIPNRFEKFYWEPTPGEWDEELPPPKTQYFIDSTKSIISENESPDLPFDYSVNPYRGCEHGCVYCYARPFHEYLGYSPGLEFETKIVIKPDAAALLRNEFLKKSYKPGYINFSGITDAYQAIEKKMGITRELLKVCLEFQNPVGIITKSSLIKRDIDVLAEMAKNDLVNVMISLTTLDKNLASAMEPRASSPAKRLEAVEALSKAGIPVGVNLAPVIPGLTDKEIPELLKAGANAGATFAHYIMLRLPFSVKEMFFTWVETIYPDRKNKIMNSVKSTRDGKLNDYAPVTRFKGTGEIADMINKVFHTSCRRNGLSSKSPKLTAEHFRRVTAQMGLF